MPDTALELLLLFSAALLAATVLPAQSEAVLAALQLTGRHTPVALVLTATSGNVLGACVNWLLGRSMERFKHRRWFPVKAHTLEKASQRYQRYGAVLLLFSWVPIIGDPLTLIAGLLRVPFWLFLLLVTLGKLARYVVIVAVL